MKHRTTASVMRGTLLVSLATGLLAFGTPGPSPSALATEWRRRVNRDVEAQPPAPHLRLVVGDTLRLVLAAGGGGTRVITLAGTEAAAMPAAFTTSAAEVVQVVDGTLLVARGPGRATIQATRADGTARPYEAFILVEVITRRRATNEVIVEVCPNRDEREILAEEQFVGDVVGIHEYHDCQKLIQDNRYVTVAGIFSPHDLAFATSRAAFADGRLVATIANFGTRKGTATYTPLGLTPGTNCLYLRAVPDSAWEAYVVGQRGFVTSAGARRYASCASRVNWATVASTGKRLDVQAYSGVDMKGDPVAPPVARWDWDSTHAYNYIGVMCGAATWCEIGPDGFDPRPPLQHTHRTTRVVRPILKGYYDEQYLANATGTQPTRVFGTITPGMDTQSHQTMQHGARRWYHVAQLTFRNDTHGKYQEYDRYVREYTGAAPSHVRRTTTSQTLHPGTSPLGPDKLSVYAGRLNNRNLPHNAVMYRFHAPHPGVTPTPTARWRWVELDEKTWSYCNPDGCCEVQQLF